MKTEIVIAGFGGQGVLSLGMTLAYAGMIEGKEVSWMPSYGPEMRGGTANCTIIISDQNISSPIINVFDLAVVLNQPSLEKFEDRVKTNGHLLYESNQILKTPTRQDISTFSVSATQEAAKLNNKKGMNMIMLGSVLKILPVVSSQSVIKALKKVLPHRHHHLIPLNQKTLQRGQELIKDKISALPWTH